MDKRGPNELDERPQARREWSGWLRSIVLPLGLVVAIVAGLLFLQSRGGGDGAEAGYGTVELPAGKNATAKAPEATAGRMAPDFLLRALEGNDVRLSDLQGRPVLVNFWATWCTSCRAEMPELVKAYETHESTSGLLVLGVNLREADSRVAGFVDDFGMSFPVLMDRSGEVARTWRIGGPNEGLPSTYFIDPAGVVQRVVYGTLTAKTLDEGLALILPGPLAMANAQTAPLSGRWSENDPLRALWRVLTSVRFALGLIAFLALGSLLGVLIPQLPVQMRDNPAAINAWLTFQEGRFGFATDAMYRAGLFSVFRSIWFLSGLVLLVGSVCVCTANRLPPIWRNVTRPQSRVPDEYFERGQPVISVAAPDVEALARGLRHRRYRVTTTQDGETTYLFADRYPWAQFATFVSHLALILFLAGGLVTVLTSREQQVLVAEGEAGAPIFAPSDRDHMQLYVEDAVGRFDETGFPLDFRSSLVVYRDGQEVARGVSTVNSPLSYGGYRFHQSAYFPDGAALRVRDLTTGRLVYDEVLALTSSATTPRVVVRDAAGKVVLDDLIIPTDFIEEAAGTRIVVPALGREFWVGARPGSEAQGWQLIVFETANPAGARALLAEGERQDLGGASITFVGMAGVPSAVTRGIPGAVPEAAAELSEGPRGALLTVGPIAGRALALSPGEPVIVGDYEYLFAGKREFAGITVRRDPGGTFIWLATGLFLLGLALTFYTPRRRLWGKIASGQAAFRGLGGRALAIDKEIRQAAGAGR